MENRVTCIIVDDEKHAIGLLSDRIKLLYSEVDIAGTYLSWDTALSAMRAQSFDLIFMDISMPGKNGMDLLKLIPELDSEIIFVTAYGEYALQAFEFSVAGYLRKPVKDTELSDAINRALKRVEYKWQARQNKTTVNAFTNQIGIPNTKGVDYINVNDILYLISINKCTKVQTRNGEYFSSNNIGKFKELTDKFSFFQVHRSYIVNLNFVVHYESVGNVIMADKKRIPVSKSVRSGFLKASNVFSKFKGSDHSD